MKKKSNFILEHPICSLMLLLTLCSLMVVVSMILAAQSKENEKKNKPKKAQQIVEETAIGVPSDGKMIGVVKEINLEDKQVTLIDLKDDIETVFSYIGGTDVRDKFDQVITMGQIEIGQIVDAEYQTKHSKLVKVQISKDAWEYQKYDDLVLNKTDKTMRIGSVKYQYNKNMLIIYQGELSNVYQIHERDQLTIRGYDTYVYSVTVTKGHGTIALVDDEKFIGGTLNIGTAVYDRITEGMTYTVREGNYNVTVENGEYSGTKNVNVFPNERTEVSIGDFGPEAVKMGKVTFEIHPFGADMVIDGELMSYKEPIELRYGEHQIEVSLGGYTTYEGKLIVDASSKELRIDLIEGTGKTSVVNGDTTGNRPSNGGSGVVSDPFAGSNDENNDWDEEVELPDGLEQEEDYTLDEDHFIYVQNPEGASVYLNGVYKLTSPGGFVKVIGTHYITFIKEGYETKSYTIEVEDDGLDAYFNFPDLGEAVE